MCSADQHDSSDAAVGEQSVLLAETDAVIILGYD